MTAPEPGQTAIGAMLKALDKSATKGPWEADSNGFNEDGYWSATSADGDVTPTDGEFGYGMDENNCKAIVTLRNALPALAAYCEAAEALHHYVTHADAYTAQTETYESARTALAAALEGEARR